MAKGYILSAAEKMLLQRMLDQQRHMPGNAPIRTPTPDDEEGGHQAPEVYIARPTDVAGTGTAGDGIPAIDNSSGPYDIPGSAECDVYQIIYNAAGDPEFRSTGFTHTVFNFSTSILTGWFLVIRDKFGYWFAVTGGGSGSSAQKHKRGLTLVTGTGTGTSTMQDNIAIDEGTPERLTRGYMMVYELVGAAKVPTGDILEFWDDGMVPVGGLVENTWVQIKQDLEEDSRWWYDGGCKVALTGTGTGTYGDWAWLP